MNYESYEDNERKLAEGALKAAIQTIVLDDWMEPSVRIEQAFCFIEQYVDFRIERATDSIYANVNYALDRGND